MLQGTVKTGSRRCCPTSPGTPTSLKRVQKPVQTTCKEEFVPFTRFSNGTGILKRERAIVGEEDGTDVARNKNLGKRTNPK